MPKKSQSDSEMSSKMNSSQIFIYVYIFTTDVINSSQKANTQKYHIQNSCDKTYPSNRSYIKHAGMPLQCFGNILQYTGQLIV